MSQEPTPSSKPRLTKGRASFIGFSRICGIFVKIVRVKGSRHCYLSPVTVQMVRSIAVVASEGVGVHRFSCTCTSPSGVCTKRNGTIRCLNFVRSRPIFPDCEGGVPNAVDGRATFRYHVLQTHPTQGGGNDSLNYYNYFLSSIDLKHIQQSTGSTSFTFSQSTIKFYSVESSNIN